MDILDKVYADLWRCDYINTDVPTSEIFYARAAIEARTGQRLELAVVQQYLEEEGLVAKPQPRRKK